MEPTHFQNELIQPKWKTEKLSLPNNQPASTAEICDPIRSMTTIYKNRLKEMRVACVWTR